MKIDGLCVKSYAYGEFVVAKKNHKVCIRCTVYCKRLAVGGLLRYLMVFYLIPYTLDLKPYFVHRRPFFYE
jgi:hypothetical protein